MPRKAKMESHPDFQRIIEAVINGRMTGRKAAKKLGTSEPNFSQYMNRHYPKHKPKRRSRRKVSDPRAKIAIQDGEPVITIRLDGAQSNEEWGAVIWKEIMQSLASTLATEPDLELRDQLRLSRTILDQLKFQFKNPVPEIPRAEVKIDKEMEQKIIDQVLADHDEWCHYRNQAIKRKDEIQDKARLEPAKSSPLERPSNRS